MEVKKTPEADLENKRSTWLLMGYVVALSLLFITFEWNSSDHNDDADWMPVLPVYEQEIAAPVTADKLPPPPPPSLPSLPEVRPLTESLTILDDLSDEEQILPFDPSELIRPSLAPPAATATEAAADTEAEIFDLVEQMPEFADGGLAGLMRYLTRQLHYPPYAVSNRIEGEVLVQFIVHTDGSIADVQAIRKVHPQLDAEAMRVIAHMPRWKPGIQEGKPVKVRCVIPVVFKLRRNSQTTKP